jgi:hypothetical protein
MSKLIWKLTKSEAKRFPSRACSWELRMMTNQTMKISTHNKEMMTMEVKAHKMMNLVDNLSQASIKARVKTRKRTLEINRNDKSFLKV